MTPEQKAHAAEALAYEEQVEEQSTAVLAAEVAAVTLLVMRAWEDVQAGGPFAPLVAAIRGFLKIAPNMSGPLDRWSARGFRIGMFQGMDTLGEDFPIGPNPTVIDDPDLKAAITGADGMVNRTLENAVQTSRAMGADLRERSNVITVVAKAQQSVTKSKSLARWVANRSVSAGTSSVAEAAGKRILWVAERNACLDCLAYSGWVAEPGKPFPLVSFATKPMGEFGTQFYPPRHPNCRCQVEVTGLAPGRSDRDLAREAERSVARGLTDFESDAERFRAADKLVRGTTLLPKSVVQRAARNIGSRLFKRRPIE